jgi:putative acetyltransferase
MRHVYLTAADSHIFEREGKVCGFCSLNQNVLAALFVAPEHQGAGIGAQLLADAKIRRPRLELAVYSANIPAPRFYERQGFVVLCEQRDEHADHRKNGPVSLQGRQRLGPFELPLRAVWEVSS